MLACRNCDWGIGNDYLTSLAKWSSVPVLSLQDDLYHPMQGIADLMTIMEKREQPRNLKVSIIWAYATSHKKPISVPVTQSLLFPRFGMDVTLAYPEGYDLPDWVIEQSRANAEKHGGSFKITHDMEVAYTDADVVIPKNWGSWVTNQSDDVIDENLESHKNWKCTEEMMAMADDDVMYMHALPADRGNEVEDSVIDGPHSIVYDEAENRLHTAKAVMALTMGGK
jgi:ornithine carbamoyltransferase